MTAQRHELTWADAFADVAQPAPPSRREQVAAYFELLEQAHARAKTAPSLTIEELF